MAAVLTGTPAALSWGTTANPASQSITIPSDATAVYMFWNYYDGGSAGNGLASVTLNGNNPDQTFEIAGTTAPTLAGGVAVWYNPATGSQTLDPAFDAAASLGHACLVAFVKDGDTTSWRDADAAAGVDLAAVTLTLTTVSGDLVLKYDSHCFSGNSPGTSAGFTSAQADADENGIGTRLSYISASGSSQACDAENENYSVVVAVSIPAGVTFTFEQKRYRFRNDDGSETTATWAAAENTGVTIAPLTPTRLRVQVGATGDPPSQGYKLQYRKVGDSTWREIN